MGRGPEFDVSQDALVRVYIHKLRKRLDDYYVGAGQHEDPRIVMPRGEYRLTLASRVPAGDETASLPELDPVGIPVPRWRRWVVAALVVSVLVNLLLLVIPRLGQDADPLAAVRKSQLWAPLFDDALPIYVVAGDYYIFGEMDENQNVKAPDPRLRHQLTHGNSSTRRRQTRPLATDITISTWHTCPLQVPTHCAT